MIIVRHPGRTCLVPPQEPGPAGGREQTAEGDEVAEAVDILRIREGS
jgi:hypothetical protein